MAIYENITRAEYNKLEGVNASKLKSYYESSLNGNYESSKPRVESSVMRFGTMVHSMILEPDLFLKDYWCLPESPINEKTGSAYGKTTKKYLEWFESLRKDVKWISESETDLLERIQENIDNNDNAQKILTACPKRETAMTWIDSETGIDCKALVDFMGDKIIGDLKTARDIPFRDDIERTATAIKWELIKNGNMLQFAFYNDGALANGINIDKFAVIFARNNGNCDTATAFLSMDSIATGREMYNRALLNWKDKDQNKSAFEALMEV